MHLDQPYAKLQIVHDMSIFIVVVLLALGQVASAQQSQTGLRVERLAELGKLWVDIYDNWQHPVVRKVLKAGDVILLIDGGHGFEVLEDCEMFEVKQGPFLGDRDKTRFYAKDFPEPNEAGDFVSAQKVLDKLEGEE